MDHQRKGGQKCVRPGNKQGRKRILPWAKRPQLIAIIDENESTQASLRKLLEAAGFVAQCFGSAEEFLESDLYRQVECLIAEMQMPGISGLELQTRLKAEQCDIPIIFIVSNGGARMRIQAMREGAVEFLAKPVDHHLLLETVRAALDL
jgi:FixJ family two-component response regulator